MKQKKEGERGLIVLATGTGKTVIMAAYTASQQGRTLIIVPSTELREQTIEKLLQADPDMDIGSVQGYLNEVSNKVIVATRQSLAHVKSKRLDEILLHGNIEQVIIDEVHMGLDQIDKIINKLKTSKIKIFGVTATPFNAKIVKNFDKIDYQKTILEMIQEGYLTEPKAMLVESSTNLNGIKTTAGEFNQKELEDRVDNTYRNKLIVKSYLEYGKERKAALVFCVGLDHMRHVIEEFKLAGIYCEGLDSTTKKSERDRIIGDFKKGKIPVVVNCGVLTTGFDYPELDTIIIARPSKSKILYTQILGRGLRLAPNKTECLIIDITDVCKSHDLLNMSSIFEVRMKHGETPTKALQRVKREEEEEAIRKAEDERIKVEREKIQLEQMKIKAQEIKLFNRDMKARTDESKYDWFRVDNLTYAVTYAMNLHYTIETHGEDYVIYNVYSDKEKKTVQYLNIKTSMIDAMKYVESKLNSNTFTDRKSNWKSDPATDAQKRYCTWAKTKWDSYCYLSASSISSILKKWKRENNGGDMIAL